jgi:hypothetical protein
VTEALEDFKRHVYRLLETEMYRVGVHLYRLGVFRGALEGSIAAKSTESSRQR